MRDSGNERVFVTERGVTFGYHNLVVDMRAFPMIRGLGVPVVFDVTHSLQLPGRRRRRHRRPGRVHRAAGVAPASPPASTACSWKSTKSPSRAKSDGQNALRLDLPQGRCSTRLVALDAIARPMQPAAVAA